MTSTERRADRYRIHYVWKIIQGLVPNSGLSWGLSGRRGLLLTIPPISGSRMAVRTLRERSFFAVAPRLYNALPAQLRGFSGSLASFKSQLDCLLLSVPDLPVSDLRPSFATDRAGLPTNSLAHWLRALATYSMARQLHEARFGTGTRQDLISRLIDSHPGLATLRDV